MSTDLRDRATPSPQPSERPPDKPKTGLSAAQVTGGAFASMTAAFLGSRLGLAGTVAGAALASVTVAIGGTLYTSSLRHTRQRVTQVWSQHAPNRRGSSVRTVTDDDVGAEDAPTRPDAPVLRASPRESAVPLATPVDTTATDTETETETAPIPTSSSPEPRWELPDDPDANQESGPRFRWKPVLVGAVAIFALAAIVLTGIELVTGHALSGGNGTTITQVAEGGGNRGADPERPQPSARPSAASTAQSTPRPGDQGPSSTPSVPAPPSASGQPSADPSTAPSASPPQPSAPQPSAPQPSAPQASAPRGSAPASPR